MRGDDREHEDHGKGDGGCQYSEEEGAGPCRNTTCILITPSTRVASHSCNGMQQSAAARLRASILSCIITLLPQIEAAAKTLQGMGVEAVLVKLGADGSLLLPGECCILPGMSRFSGEAFI